MKLKNERHAHVFKNSGSSYYQICPKFLKFWHELVQAQD